MKSWLLALIGIGVFASGWASGTAVQTLLAKYEAAKHETQLRQIILGVQSAGGRKGGHGGHGGWSHNFNYSQSSDAHVTIDLPNR